MRIGFLYRVPLRVYRVLLDWRAPEHTPSIVEIPYKTPTWTPKVCRIMAFYRFWAIILPTFGGLG